MTAVEPGFSLDPWIGPGDALIVVPPFAGLDRPSLASHLLQAAAAEAGFAVRVLYANLLFAAEIGPPLYTRICYAPTSGLAGERVFAAAAYGVPLLGRAETLDPAHFRRCDSEDGAELAVDSLRAVAERAGDWCDRLARAIAASGFRVVGCTTTFEQTAASLALLRRLKRHAPETLTLLGGANCDGEMAEGLLSLGSPVDYIFSGESEKAFPAFLAGVAAGRLPPHPVVTGEPCMDLDALPTPSFEEFYRQVREILPEGDSVAAGTWLPYETSRGCWWGAKRHCTFCGLNAQTLTHREKGPDRVLADLRKLLAHHPNRNVCMVDNIMPHSYFRTLLPRLAEEMPGLHLFYEQKSNLSLAHALTLKQAGIEVIQPGIEALSTALLQRMRKGVTARQNVALLRFSRAVDLSLNWNLLYAFPGDGVEEYRQTLELLPLIRHLEPPGGLYHLSIDRFSPYFDHPAEHGVSAIQPLEGYGSVLPEGAAVEKIAYHFTASYPSGIRESPDLLRELDTEVARWRAAWRTPDQAPPSLALTPLDEDVFFLLDTRGIEGTETVQFLDRPQAALVLKGARPGDSVDCGWALERGLLAELDGHYVPLAVAEPALLRQLGEAA